MKVKLSISIAEDVYNLSLKDQRNVSRYIEQLLKEQYIEDHKTSIAKSVAGQLKLDDDFRYFIKQAVEAYMEERRNF